MTDKQSIFLTWLVIFAVAFMGMVTVQEHVNSINKEQVDPITSTYTVLESHGFYDWSEHDKELLTQMMQVTAASALGIETELSFGELASTAPVHVLETYIDLLESAGY